TDAYFGDHPYLTAAAADWLAENGAALVGIDSCNIDNMHVRARPVHTRLLGAEIPICEHMTALGSLPDDGFRFSAVPPTLRQMGTLPVRAYAVLGYAQRQFERRNERPTRRPVPTSINLIGY